MRDGKMTIRASRVITFSLLVLLAATVPLAARGKKKILVLGFEDAAVQKSVQRIFGAEVAVGRGLSALVEHYLLLDGTYKVIPRKKLEKALAKKKFANFDPGNPEHIRRLGKAVKADAVLVGSVTGIGSQTRRSQKGRRKTGRAIVVVTTRLYGVRKGTLLAQGERAGVSERKSKTGALLGDGFAGFSNGAADFARSDFQATLLGEAASALADDLTHSILDVRDQLGVKQFSITATVTSVEGGSAHLNMGEGFGLKVGQRLAVRRITAEKKDKKSGVVFNRRTRLVAVVEVVALDPLSTTMRIVSGSGIKVGDEVNIVMD